MALNSAPFLSHTPTTSPTPLPDNADFASKAVKSMFDDRSARASHVLLKGPDAEIACVALQKRISDGEISFADAAREYSTCPSSAKGGDLGTFKPGAMVPEFDAVVFDESVAIGEVRGMGAPRLGRGPISQGDPPLLTSLRGRRENSAGLPLTSCHAPLTLTSSRPQVKMATTKFGTHLIQVLERSSPSA